MTLAAGLLATLLMAGAAVTLLTRRLAISYALALGALAADALCDIGCTGRLPAIARLARRPLEAVSAGNWACSILGAALGSVAAGWAWSHGAQAGVLAGLVACMAGVWLAMSMILPWSPRAHAARRKVMAYAHPVLWLNASRHRLLVAVAVLTLIAGPVDQLLIPAQLAAQGRPAASFGWVLGALCLGLATGLAIMASLGRRWPARHIALAALLGLAMQIYGLIAEPSHHLLYPAVAVGAALVAPALPTLEAALLRAAPAAARTPLLAALALVAASADAAGALLYGVTLQRAGSTAALHLCAALILLATLATCAFGGRSRAA